MSLELLEISENVSAILMWFNRYGTYVFLFLPFTDKHFISFHSWRHPIVKINHNMDYIMLYAVQKERGLGPIPGEIKGKLG